MQCRIGSSANMTRRRQTSARPTISCQLVRYAETMDLPTVMKSLALMFRHILLLWWQINLPVLQMYMKQRADEDRQLEQKTTSVRIQSFR